MIFGGDESPHPNSIMVVAVAVAVACLECWKAVRVSPKDKQQIWENKHGVLTRLTLKELPLQAASDEG